MSPVYDGRVQWTGDNPFIYVQGAGATDWTALALYFRIAAGGAGHGHAILVLEHPYEPERPGTRRCLTDAPDLWADLERRFVRRFPLFRPAGAALDCVEVVAGAQFDRETTPGGADHLERGCSDGRELALHWYGLRTPIAVAQDPSESATGQHVMLAVFRPATSAEIRVDGAALPGQVIDRDFLGGRHPSAALALSETWIDPRNG
jgi:hypothetical protein